MDENGVGCTAASPDSGDGPHRVGAADGGTVAIGGGTAVAEAPMRWTCDGSPMQPQAAAAAAAVNTDTSTVLATIAAMMFAIMGTHLSAGTPLVAAATAAAADDDSAGGGDDDDATAGNEPHHTVGPVLLRCASCARDDVGVVTASHPVARR